MRMQFGVMTRRRGKRRWIEDGRESQIEQERGRTKIEVMERDETETGGREGGERVRGREGRKRIEDYVGDG